MNLKWIGDAHDHWKGSLLAQLQEVGLLHRLAVDAMATDQTRWSHNEQRLYCALLHISDDQLTHHTVEFTRLRDLYIQEIRHSGDLFLDPDTGVATGKVSDLAKYILPSELVKLLGQADRRVVAVYQHIRARAPMDRVNEVVRAIWAVLPSCSCFSYNSSMAAVLFLSIDLQRLERIEKHYRSLFGNRAAQRIHLWRAA